MINNLIISLVAIVIITIIIIIFVIKNVKIEKYIDLTNVNNIRKLIYLYKGSNECPNCITFNNTWKTVQVLVIENPFFYQYKTEQYNISTDPIGIKYATDNNITNVPTIIYVSPEGVNKYMGNNNAIDILSWANSF